MAYVTSIERIGIEKGLQQGIQQGLQQGIQQGLRQGILLGLRQMLVELLNLRFGMVPTDAVEIVWCIEDGDVLKQLFRQAVQCADLKEFLVRLDEVGSRAN